MAEGELISLNLKAIINLYLKEPRKRLKALVNLKVCKLRTITVCLSFRLTRLFARVAST